MWTKCGEAVHSRKRYQLWFIKFKKHHNENFIAQAQNSGRVTLIAEGCSCQSCAKRRMQLKTLRLYISLGDWFLGCIKFNLSATIIKRQKMANLGFENTETPAMAEDWTKYYSLVYVAVIILLVWIGVRDEITIIVAIVFGALGIALRQSWTLIAMFLLFSILYLLIPRFLQGIFGTPNSAADSAVGRVEEVSI